MIRKEILLGNYWEHFKLAKDLASIYDIDNPKRLRIEEALEEIQVEINKCK